MSVILNSIEGMMYNAKIYAQKGNIELAEFCLKPAYSLIEKLDSKDKTVIEECVKKIRIDAYTNCIKNYIEKVRDKKLSDNSIIVKHMRNVLKDLKDIDSELGKSLESELGKNPPMTGE